MLTGTETLESVVISLFHSCREWARMTLSRSSAIHRWEKTKHMATELVRLIVHQGINEGNLETFKEMARHFTAVVEVNEPDTMCYEYYVSHDGADGYVVLTFVNSDALCLHYARSRETGLKMPNVGPIVEALVLGSPNAKAREELAWLKPKYLPHLVGYTR